MKDLTIGNALFYNKQIDGEGEQNIKIQDLTPFVTQGPSIDWLRNKANKTWGQIIESASRPGGKDLGY